MFKNKYGEHKRPLSHIGFYADGWVKHLLLGGLFGIILIALAVIIMLVTGMARLENTDLGGASDILFWNSLILFILVGFFEEILSRGLMMTALKPSRNKWIIVLVPSAVFGFLHIFNDNVTAFSLVNIALIGVLFAYLFIKTGRLWAPIGLHISWNFVQGSIFGIPVSGISAFEDFSIINIVFTGPEWLTGGAFGAEGGAICTLVITAGLLFTYFCVKQSDNFWRMEITPGLPADDMQAEKFD